MDLAFDRVLTLVAGDVSSNDASRCTAEVSELQIMYSCLAAQLSGVTSECGPWSLLARKCGDDSINLRASLDMSEDGSKRLEGQIAVLQEEKEPAALERDACNAKAGCPQTFLSRYRDACNHVVERLRDEGVRLKARREAAVNRAEDEVSRFLCVLVLSMMHCVGKNIAQAQASVNKQSSMNVDIFRSVAGSLHNTVSVESVLDHNRTEVSSIILSCGVFLLPWSGAGPNGDSSAVQASAENRATSSSRAKENSKTPPKRSTKLCKTSMIRALCNAATASSDDMPVIHQESD